MRNYSKFLLLLIILTAIVAYNCQGAEAKERILERAISEQEVWERVSEPIIEEPAPEEEVAAEPGEEVAPPPKEPKKGWVRTINESISPLSSFFSSALAIADLRSFSIILAAALSVKAKISSASLTFLPLIKSTTCLAFVGEVRIYFIVAFACIPLTFSY